MVKTSLVLKDYSHKRSKLRCPWNKPEQPGGGNSKYYYGLTSTGVTQSLHPPVPKHAGHPSMKDVPPTYFGREGTNVTEMCTYMSRGKKPPSRDQYFGREATDVSAFLRIVPSRPLEENMPRPYFGRPTTYVTDPSKPIDCGPEIPGRVSRTEQRQPLGKTTPGPWNFYNRCKDSSCNKENFNRNATPISHHTHAANLAVGRTASQRGRKEATMQSPGPINAFASAQAANTPNDARDRLQTSMGSRRPKLAFANEAVSSATSADLPSTTGSPRSPGHRGTNLTITSPAPCTMTRKEGCRLHSGISTVQWSDQETKPGSCKSGSTGRISPLRDPSPGKSDWSQRASPMRPASPCSSEISSPMRATSPGRSESPTYRRKALSEPRSPTCSHGGSEQPQSPGSSIGARMGTSHCRSPSPTKSASPTPGSDLSKSEASSIRSSASSKPPKYPTWVLSEPAHFEVPYFGKCKTDVTDPTVSTRFSPPSMKVVGTRPKQEHIPGAGKVAVIGKTGKALVTPRPKLPSPKPQNRTAACSPAAPRSPVPESPIKDARMMANQCVHDVQDKQAPPWFGRRKSYVTDPSVSP